MRRRVADWMAENLILAESDKFSRGLQWSYWSRGMLLGVNFHSQCRGETALLEKGSSA